jgi:hypothetical protein
MARPNKIYEALFPDPISVLFNLIKLEIKSLHQN